MIKTILYCDRCKDIVTSSLWDIGIEIRKTQLWNEILVLSYMHNPCNKVFQVCEKCRDRILNFLNGEYSI